MRKILIYPLTILLLLSGVMLQLANVFTLQAEGQQTSGPEITSPSAILMEAAGGNVIWEKDADTRRAPASVTKVMTLLLIFDALEEGKIALEDDVQTSDYAASMGGSQVFLEPGETQTVDTLIKCIAVASANDACVAMAEYISGSEEAFVEQMNQRAEGLGMVNTHFVNCNGLDTDGHETTARDIALMSRELITYYPKIHEYSMIWMDTITHMTRKGTSEFGLTNTNKLIRQYAYATGLKTGSTSNAGFCVSATAEKDGVELIAVIMGADNSKDRFQDAVKLLDYGFGKCTFYVDDAKNVAEVPVTGGIQEEVSAHMAGEFRYVDITGADLSQIRRKVEVRKGLRAPVEKGDPAGEMVYYLNGKEIGRQKLVASENVGRMRYTDALERAMDRFFLENAKHQ
jgi:D-alanyl-D-alanine carboxypeptidase (penicillin-binding protein 5/6)